MIADTDKCVGALKALYSSDPPARPGRAPCGIASSPRVASIETTLAPQLAPTQKLAWHEGGPKGLGHLWDSRGQPMLDQ